MSKQIPLVVHATHEAGVKVGGIGSVLDGLLSAQNYNHQVARTVLVGPMNGQDSIEMERLTSPRNGLDIRYSSLHGIFHGAPAPMRDDVTFVCSKSIVNTECLERGKEWWGDGQIMIEL